MNALTYPRIDPYSLNSFPIRERGQKILIVEDEPLWQLLISRALRRIDQKIEVSFSSCAQDAIEMIQNSESFDLIIADHFLEGGKTGLDLWDTLQTQKSETPYLILSGLNRIDFLEDLMPYRVERIPQFIEKPRSVKELAARLSEAVHSVGAKKTPEKKPLSKSRYWTTGIAILVGLYASYSILDKKVNSALHPIYTEYLGQLSQNTVLPATASVFTKEVVESMNQVAIDRSFLSALKK